MIDRIGRTLRINEGRVRALIAGDEETFRTMVRLKKSDPQTYFWLFPYPGDWHLLFHSAKALIARYWGAGIEYVAKGFSGDDLKAVEARDYRRAHHQVTVMYEALMIVVWMEFCSSTNRSPEEPGVESEVTA